jgi:hypothetical protein
VITIQYIAVVRSIKLICWNWWMVANLLAKKTISSFWFSLNGLSKYRVQRDLARQYCGVNKMGAHIKTNNLFRSFNRVSFLGCLLQKLSETTIILNKIQNGKWVMQICRWWDWPHIRNLSLQSSFWKFAHYFIHSLWYDSIVVLHDYSALVMS